MPPDSWEEWSQYVLKELKRLNDCYEALRGELIALRVNDLPEIKTEIALLKLKAGVWGAVGATIPVLILLAIQMLRQ